MLTLIFFSRQKFQFQSDVAVEWVKQAHDQAAKVLSLSLSLFLFTFKFEEFIVIER